MAQTFLVKIKGDGVLDFGSAYNWARWIDYSNQKKGKMMRLEEPEVIRSLSQNALYWVWLKKVELETGNESDDLHIYLKSKFLPKRLIKIKGRHGEHGIETMGSTTKLRKVEFGEYLDKCAVHVGIPIPTKEEIMSMGYISN